MKHRSHRRSHRRRRGGASSASTYAMEVNGNSNSQFNRVFDINSGFSPNGNSIVGIQGQKAGRRHSRKHQKGGMWGQILSTAAVPLSLLGLQQTYGKKHHSKGHSGGSHRRRPRTHRRHR